MVDQDPFEVLTRVGGEPQRPDAAFADRLLQDLVSELSSIDAEARSDLPPLEPVPIAELRQDHPMRPKRWTWAAAVAAALLAVIVIAISTRGDGDTVIVDEPPTTIEEVEDTTTPTPQPTPTTTPPPPVRTDGPAWCARTTTVLADIDDDGNYLLEALQAWVEEAPPDMVEAVQEYDALVRTAPPLRAADPDFDTKFEQARTRIDAYVADNC